MAGRASSSITYEWIYDVFLSFRGEDTRLGFTGNLYKSLCDKGIRAFMEDEELQLEDEITPSLVKAIKNSRIAMVIFSENYAFSSFCLDELTIILECSKENGSLVLPIFYGVDPAEVLYQRGCYGQALARHEERLKNDKDRVNKWRMALYHAASLSGYHFRLGVGYKNELIDKIITMVSSKITLQRLPEDEVHPTTVQNDPPVMEKCHGGDDAEMEAVSVSSCELESEESSSNATSSDSDDPFNLVDEKLCVSGSKITISWGASSADASLTSIREAINALEMFMVNDLSEVSSDLSMQSGLHQLLDQLSTSNHPRVTVEVKEALAGFKRKACASFQEFQATVESVNKLKNFEKQKAKIQNEVSAGKARRKDLKNSIKKASLSIMAENSRMKELQAEIATLREQLTTKEMDLEQLVLKVKNQEAELLPYMENRDSLDKQARVLFNEVNDLLVTNRGVEDEGKVAEAKQNVLKLTWSADLTSHLEEIKNNIFGPYE